MLYVDGDVMADVYDYLAGFKRVMINPVVLESSPETCEFNEGCLSVPGRQGVVTRPMKVKVRAQDRKGNEIEVEAEGFAARAICHELDHLDGVMYVDKMDRELTEDEIRGHIPEDDEQ